jgi:hypothetical protein
MRLAGYGAVVLRKEGDSEYGTNPKNGASFPPVIRWRKSARSLARLVARVETHHLFCNSLRYAKNRSYVFDC